MNDGGFSRDLVVLTEGKNDQNAVRGILTRQRVLAIRGISADFLTHPERASGIWRHAHEFLRPFHRSHAHALVLMDREGGGAQVERQPRAVLERKIEQHLSTNGWKGRAAAIVIDPEIEIWVWSRVPEVEAALGWTSRSPGLWEWAEAKGFLRAGQAKPVRPKEAMEAALTQVHKPRSSMIYRQLAENVNFAGCTDPAFLKLRQTLGNWFAKG
jgi:hypothetical protein